MTTPLLNEQELGPIFGRYSYRGARQFRMEVAPWQPTPGTEADDFRSYVGPGPLVLDWDRKERHLAAVRQEERDGIVCSRVRRLSKVLTDYERYEVECCLLANDAAGDVTGVLHVGEHDIPDAVIDQDFWLLDDDLVIVMYYERGEFLGGELVDDPEEVELYVAARDAALAAAEAVAQWWEHHPELHRSRWAA